ncbi:MAG TPA: response regulator [Anaerohalosphaeraceae bacterium]|nr:response regulator [Phycisphaerae bacterium]HOK95645.1 response regulator [Anaerohalosphaeraceae bacterium]HOL32444.1 response regulator [Anaerohalosphaeraceae bacterium]HOM77086.1 response regulator [Anaerohalosphaeraceae bacterium]HPC64226.1 response regulator [Anaerohalosphaeraceae bacterium]
MFDFFGLCKKSCKTKILVVDDEPNIVQTLKDRLEMNEYTVFTAANGQEGLQMAQQESPDLVLLDVIMPIMDGHEMLEQLRRQPWGRTIPVIMLTARSQAQDIARARACEIEDYIIKPFDLSELLEKIENIIERRKSLVS